jgi:hypothetical protein
MASADARYQGGLLYHDSVHGVWLYEGEAVQSRLAALKDVRTLPLRSVLGVIVFLFCCCDAPTVWIQSLVYASVILFVFKR